MLRINCKVGMKLTTTGDPSSGGREYSDCCNHEKKYGFIYVLGLCDKVVEVTDRRGASTEFKYDCVHPYLGGAE